VPDEGVDRAPTMSAARGRHVAHALDCSAQVDASTLRALSAIFFASSPIRSRSLIVWITR
jgi:hypothetical protein